MDWNPPLSGVSIFVGVALIYVLLMLVRRRGVGHWHDFECSGINVICCTCRICGEKRCDMI